MAERILVTGATGNVGGALARLLIDAGQDVLVAARDPAKASARFRGGARYRRLDFDDPATLHGIGEGVDRAFLVIPPGDAAAFAHLAPLVDALRSDGTRHCVLMTAIGVDQAPDSVPHRALERHLQSSGMGWTILRPNWFMQNFTTGFLGEGIRKAGAIFLPAGEGRSAFIDARDIAAVAAACLQGDAHAGREYPLTGPEALTYGEAADLIAGASGRPVAYHPVTDAQALEGMLAQGWPADSAAFMVGLFTPVRNGWVSAVSPAVQQVTGRAPLSLAEFAREHAAQWR